MTATLSFGTPPPSRERGPRIEWQTIAEQLYDNPGQWAKVDTPVYIGTARTKASQVKRGRARGFEDGTWDARVERIEGTEEMAHVWLICISPDAVDDDVVPFD